MNNLQLSNRIISLKEKMLQEERFASIEQAKIITNSYKENEGKPRIIQRALSLKSALEQLEIAITPEELIVGNRTAGVRYGVVFPESGSTWVDKEFESLPTRAQDKFQVRKEDIEEFRSVIKPYWEGKSLEDILRKEYGKEFDHIAKVVKINQKDHAQGHICPNCKEWLKKGISGLKKEADEKMANATGSQKDFYESVSLVMEGTINFINRYVTLLNSLAEKESNIDLKNNMLKVAGICEKIGKEAPTTFHEAVQSIWFLFVILQMESNASSFSPGRLDDILIDFYENDINSKNMDSQEALEILECLFLKFNEIVYMRNAHSAKFFAGFPIGFNIVIGGQDEHGKDFSNDVSMLFLKAQEHLGLPQPNLSVRLHENTNDKILKEAVNVVSKGSGMPQFFNDKAIIPSMLELGIEKYDAMNYAVVGCVELTTQGNNLGWSDSAMFNLNKVLELTLTGGKCLLNGEQLATNYGDITTYNTYEELEVVFTKYLDEYMEAMIVACEKVEKAHMELLPSPFLSSVIDGCMEKGIDVTAGGAKYNFSGIQMIQVANLADSMAAIKYLIFDTNRVEKAELLNALEKNFEGYDVLRAKLLNKVDKYGNDVDWVDEIGSKWAEYFKAKLSKYTNYRGGKYHTGMYTVSAHVPMGENVGASPDGRSARKPLADGGMSPVYGRDVKGPTAVLKSVSKLDKNLTSNGGLLNMKFLPEFFTTEHGIDKFADFLRTYVDLEIPHIQFNVVRREDLMAAKENPGAHKNLTIRVAGYTAYFVELADELQNEIISRTSYSQI